MVDRIANDPVLMFDLVYILCESQLSAKNVSAEDFSASITGDTVEQAATVRAFRQQRPIAARFARALDQVTDFKVESSMDNQFRHAIHTFPELQ